MAAAIPDRPNSRPPDPRVLQVSAIEPLLFRDGRALGSVGGMAASLPVPLPANLAGCIRTCVGEARGWNWSGDGPAMARATAIAGPVACVNGAAVFARPADAVVLKSDDGSSKPQRVMVLRPGDASAGSDIPGRMRAMAVTEDGKPDGGYGWWGVADTLAWLASTGASCPVPARVQLPPTEERMHVSIDDETQTAQDSELFSTTMVSYENRRGDAGFGRTDNEWSFLVRCEPDVAADARGFATPGAERRLAILDRAPVGAWPECPAPLEAALGQSSRIRLQLATPALFAEGWRPGWLDADLEGSPPGMEGLRLKLVGAAAGRREPISGWDYEKSGPKAVRWMVPAGSVFFFEVLERVGEESPKALWLQSICDNEQDRRDGFGLALWGVW